MENREQFGISLIQSRLLAYAKYVDFEYKTPQHIRKIASYLEKVSAGTINRLIIETPPRHGKSYLVSQIFPAWYLGNHPDHRIIAASHTSMLAEKNSRHVRNLINEFGKYIFGISLSKDSKGVQRWDLASPFKGGCVSGGIGGNLTGSGAHLLLIDDPIKSMKDARSETVRESIIDWYKSVARTRLQKNGRIIIINTRWHEADLCGFLLDGNLEKFERLRLPAIAEDEDDPLGREIGEPLWPSEFGLEMMELTKKQVGSQVWASLYQQRPAAQEGGLIKRAWIKYYNRIPDNFDMIINSWDMSFKDTGSSFVVGQVWGKLNNNYYLIEQEREKMDFTKSILKVKALRSLYPKTSGILIEDKANGPAIISVLKNEISGIIPITPRGTKDARLSAVSPLIESGNVYLPDPSLKSWVDEFVDELVTFPNAKNDDQVDALTMALDKLNSYYTINTKLYRNVGPKANAWAI